MMRSRAEDSDVAEHVVAGVDGDVAEEDGDITLDVAMNLHRAEGAGNVAGGLAGIDDHFVAEAGVVARRVSEGAG